MAMHVTSPWGSSPNELYGCYLGGYFMQEDTLLQHSYEQSRSEGETFGKQPARYEHGWICMSVYVTYGCASGIYHRLVTL